MSKLIKNLLKIKESCSSTFTKCNTNEFVIITTSIILRHSPTFCSNHFSIFCHDVIMKGDCI